MKKFNKKTEMFGKFLFSISNMFCKKNGLRYIRILSVCYLLLFLIFSCKEIYNPDINTNREALIIEGLITDDNVAYYVKLSYSSPFNSNSSTAARGATVYVTDNNNNKYIFKENLSVPGMYYSDPVQFIGIHGNVYTLFVTTNNGISYQSTPQKLLPNILPSKIYGEKNIKKELVTIGGFKQSISKVGASFFQEYNSVENAIPRFRYTYATLVGYETNITLTHQTGFLDFDIYGWKFTPFLTDLYLTDQRFQVYSNQSQKYEGYFFVRNDFMKFPYYKVKLIGTDSLVFSIDPANLDSTIRYTIRKRILYQKQYRLNNDSYEFYKSVKKQLSSEDKIFDPMNPQVIGNIICTSDSEALVFGLFETSSVIYSAYELYFRSSGNPIFTKTNYITPPPAPDGITFIKPDFWGN